MSYRHLDRSSRGPRPSESCLAVIGSTLTQPASFCLWPHDIPHVLSDSWLICTNWPHATVVAVWNLPRKETGLAHCKAPVQFFFFFPCQRWAALWLSLLRLWDGVKPSCPGQSCVLGGDHWRVSSYARQFAISVKSSLVGPAPLKWSTVQLWSTWDGIWKETKSLWLKNIHLCHKMCTSKVPRLLKNHSDWIGIKNLLLDSLSPACHCSLWAK